MPSTFPIKWKGKAGELVLWFDRFCIHTGGGDEHRLVRVSAIDVLHRKDGKLTLYVGKDRYAMTMEGDADACWAAVKECCFPAE